MPTTLPSDPTLRRSWILLLVTAFLLGGCHARSGCHHSHGGCGADAGDGIIAAFHLFYLLGWIIVCAAEG
jgi:hypothetical protein